MASTSPQWSASGWITLSLFLTACSGSEGGQGAGAIADDPQRNIKQLNIDRMWARGGASEDTTLFAPWRLRATRDQVAVLDPGGHKVRTFAAATGRDLWSFGRKGEGPMEFDQLHDIVPLPEGWVAWDRGVGRLTSITSAGKLDSMVPLRSALIPGFLCPLGNGTFGAITLAGRVEVGVVSREGTMGETDPLPWPALEALDPIQAQAEWAYDGKGTCILLVSQSTGFAMFDADGFGSHHEYVEAMTPPTATVSTSNEGRRSSLGEFQLAVQDGFVLEDELWVLFYGKTADAGRFIDVYDARTGQYRRTHRLPFADATSMARLGDVLFFLRTVDGYPLLEAYRITEQTEQTPR